jgi:hypothetical protein
MICHSQLYTQAQMLEPGRASLVEKSADHWQRVNVLPDYVYFDHSIHVDKILQRAANCGRQRVAVVVQAARSLNSMADGPGSSSRSVWRISAGAEPGGGARHDRSEVDGTFMARIVGASSPECPHGKGAEFQACPHVDG